jgi:hypothetical protein
VSFEIGINSIFGKMEGSYSDRESESLLQDFEEIPPTNELYGLDFDLSTGRVGPSEPGLPFLATGINSPSILSASDVIDELQDVRQQINILKEG